MVHFNFVAMLESRSLIYLKICHTIPLRRHHNLEFYVLVRSAITSISHGADFFSIAAETRRTYRAVFSEPKIVIPDTATEPRSVATLETTAVKYDSVQASAHQDTTISISPSLVSSQSTTKNEKKRQREEVPGTSSATTPPQKEGGAKKKKKSRSKDLRNS